MAKNVISTAQHPRSFRAEGYQKSERVKFEKKKTTPEKSWEGETRITKEPTLIRTVCHCCNRTDIHDRPLRLYQHGRKRLSSRQHAPKVHIKQLPRLVHV